MKIYPEFTGQRRLFVLTGEFRAPKAGEYYLSGAIPEVYLAPVKLANQYHIARPATHAEVYCECCGRQLPSER